MHTQAVMRPQDFLTQEEFARLKSACKDDRELAIVMTLGGTGMRVNELCNLKIEDLDLDNNYIHIEVAKGGRPRTVVAPGPVIDALQTHLQSREAGYVFPGRQDGHLSSRQVQRILDVIAVRAGLQNERPVLQRSR